jgi:hypothetical protein
MREFQMQCAAGGGGLATTVFRRKGRWGGSDLQMSVVPPDGKDILNLRKIAKYFLITLDHEKGEYILSYDYCPILVPTAYRAQKFAYDCYPIPPIELTMVHWRFSRQIWM